MAWPIIHIHNCLLEEILLYHSMQEKAVNLKLFAGRRKQFRCAFFTGGANRTGGWSYRGLKTQVINDTHVQCQANHLATFAVLVSIVPREKSVSIDLYELQIENFTTIMHNIIMPIS